MKTSRLQSLRHLCIALLVSAVITSAARAQAPAATPAPPAATPAAKAKPLGILEKKFFKDASEAILVEQKLVLLVGKEVTVSEGTSKALTKIAGELKRIWEALATLSQSTGAEMTLEVGKADAANAAKIAKLKDERLEKELLKDLEKETKKAVRLFEAAGKTLQDPDVKKFASDWAPTVKSQHASVEAAEKAFATKK